MVSTFRYITWITKNHKDAMVKGGVLSHYVQNAIQKPMVIGSTGSAYSAIIG